MRDGAICSSSSLGTLDHRAEMLNGSKAAEGGHCFIIVNKLLPLDSDLRPSMSAAIAKCIRCIMRSSNAAAHADGASGGMHHGFDI